MYAEAVNVDVDNLVMNVFTGQCWWRSGLEADAETSAG